MNLNLVDVLFVEDNSSDAELAIRELRKHNMTSNLYHVKDGEEALEFVFATGRYAQTRSPLHPPRLVLLDIQMPKVNGIEVLRRIKSDERTKAIPVVMFTSSKENPDVLTCYGLGVNSYIVKPMNFESFAQAIRNLGNYWLLLNQSPT